MRPSDYAYWAGASVAGPTTLWLFNVFHPAYAGRGAFASAMRTNIVISLFGGFYIAYTRSCCTLPSS